MERFIKDEKNGLWYERKGDYYFPCLTAPESPQVGKYGRLRQKYLRENQRGIYDGMHLHGTLNTRLEEIDRTAIEMLDRLVRQMAEAEGVTEDIKATDQMSWAWAMNNIEARAEEIVLHDLIYV